MTKSINDLRRNWLLAKYPVNTSITDLIHKHATTAPVSSNYLENRLGVTFAELRTLYPGKALNDALWAFYQTPGAPPLTFGVTLSSVVGGLPASGSGIVTINQVAPPPPVNAITPVIAVSRSTGVAPLAVTFDALGTTAPALTSLPFSEIYYAWTFGDPAGGATWAYGTNPGVALKNEAIGPVAAHVFETHSASPYTVTCWAFYLDSGGTLHSGSSTTAITVTNADTVFSGTATICISQNSLPVAGVGGAPAGCAVQQVPNWNTIQTLAQTYKRILLKRGDTWDVNGEAAFAASQVGPGIIGAYGTGNKPVATVNINAGALRFQSGGNDWRVMDLTVTSNDLVEQNFGRGITAALGNDILLLRTDVEKTGRILVEGGASAGMYIADCVVGPASARGTNSICVYISSQDRVGILGSRVYGSRDHSARLQGTAKTVISNNLIEQGSPTSHLLTVRGKSNDAEPGTWNGLWTENVVISDNLINGMTGSISAVALKPVNYQGAERLRSMIFERNRVMAMNTEAIFAQVSEALTIRNNILTTGYGFAISIGAGSDVGSPPPTSGWIYNNTVYKGNTTYGTSFGAIYTVTGVTGYVIQNNLAYAPGNTSPTMFLGTGVEGVAYTQSNNSSNAQILSSLPFVNATPVVAADFAPAGYAVNGGAWVPVYKNYLGATNSAPREIGAI
jgi:hypothetical protein